MSGVRRVREKRRKRTGLCGVVAGEADAFFGKTVEDWCLDVVTAIGREVAPTQVVSDNDEEIGLHLRRCALVAIVTGNGVGSDTSRERESKRDENWDHSELGTQFSWCEMGSKLTTRRGQPRKVPCGGRQNTAAERQGSRRRRADLRVCIEVGSKTRNAISPLLRRREERTR